AGKEVETIQSITASEFNAALGSNPSSRILDVRKPTEYHTGHLHTAILRPLDEINDWMPQVDSRETYYIHCAGGYRSMIAASILKARGIGSVINIEGGYGAIQAALS